MEREGNSDSLCCWRPWNDLQRIGKGTRRLKNKRISSHHPNYTVSKIGQNTEKSPRDLRRLAVTQTPSKMHQLTLVR